MEPSMKGQYLNSPGVSSSSWNNVVTPTPFNGVEGLSQRLYTPSSKRLENPFALNSSLTVSPFLAVAPLAMRAQQGLQDSLQAPLHMFQSMHQMPPSLKIDPDAKVFTRLEVDGYRPSDFYIEKLWAWLQVQGRGLLDVRAVDAAVKQRLRHFRGTNLGHNNSRNVYELFGLGHLDEAGQRLGTWEALRHPQRYGKQLGRQTSFLKGAFKAWMRGPQSIASGVKQFLHASFTKPFSNLWAGEEVISSSLSGLATILFAYDIGRKTWQANRSAYNEGERGGDLAQSTATEFGKETLKGGASWVAGSVGASLVGRTFGTTLKSIPDASKFARLRTLPMRLMYILGAVLAGSTVKAGLDYLLPSRPIVEKLSLNELKAREAKKTHDQTETET